jgi:hypothetical protein
MGKILLALILATTVGQSACQTELAPNVKAAQDATDRGDEQFEPEFNRQLNEFISKSETFTPVPSHAKNP